MPICFAPRDLRGKVEAGDEVPANALSDWREPPGYLGEAVRRAKRISKQKQCPPQACDNRPAD